MLSMGCEFWRALGHVLTTSPLGVPAFVILVLTLLWMVILRSRLERSLSVRWTSALHDSDPRDQAKVNLLRPLSDASIWLIAL